MKYNTIKKQKLSEIESWLKDNGYSKIKGYFKDEVYGWWKTIDYYKIGVLVYEYRTLDENRVIDYYRLEYVILITNEKVLLEFNLYAPKIMPVDFEEIAYIFFKYIYLKKLDV